MRFYARPLYNIKNIDIKALIWVGLWVLFLGAVVIPSQIQIAFLEYVRFLFSFDFIEVESLSSEPMSPFSSNLGQSFANRYELLNFSKVIIWILTASVLLVFLFKQPKTNT